MASLLDSLRSFGNTGSVPNTGNVPQGFDSLRQFGTFLPNRNLDPAIIGMQNGQPDYGYGNRYQSNQPKGVGYYGELQRPDGGHSTELSVDVGRGDIPAMVPGLSTAEMSALLSAKDGEKFPNSVYDKAASHAAFRELNGQSPWAGINDSRELAPDLRDKMVSQAMLAPNDPPTKKISKYGVDTRSLYPSEDKFFKGNPHVGGMAADDNKVIVNPYSTLNDQERQAIVMNESARVHMRVGNVPSPTFDLTPEQQAAFKSYSPNSNDIKQTIAARVLTNDPSALNATKEQRDYAYELGKYMLKR
jgi:hypothetical protein